jgi:hypothetical protein
MTGHAFKDCPTLSERVDHKQLKSARKLLPQSFPDFVSIRHSVSHAAELRDEAEKRKIEGVIGEVFPMLRGFPFGTIRTRMLIRNALHGRKFLNTFQGRLRAYEISTDTAASLNRIKEAAYVAFARCPSAYQPVATDR